MSAPTDLILNKQLTKIATLYFSNQIPMFTAWALATQACHEFSYSVPGVPFMSGDMIFNSVWRLLVRPHPDDIATIELAYEGNAADWFRAGNIPICWNMNWKEYKACMETTTTTTTIPVATAVDAGAPARVRKPTKRP